MRHVDDLGRPPRGAGRSAPRGGGRLRRRSRVPRAAARTRPPRRGAGAPRRRTGTRSHLGRARLLAATAPPEDRRGVALARVVDAALRTALGAAAIAIARRAGYRGAGTAEFLLARRGSVVVPRDERAPAGRAPRHRGGHGHRPGPRAARDRRRRPDGGRAGACGAPRATRSRRASTPRTPRTGSCPRRGASDDSSCPTGPGCASTPRSRTGDIVGIGLRPAPRQGGRVRPRIARPPSLGSVPRSPRSGSWGSTTNLGFLLDALGRDEVREGTADTDWVERSWTPDVARAARRGAAAGDPRDPWVAFGAGAGDDAHDVTVAGSHAQYRGWAYRLGDDELAADRRWRRPAARSRRRCRRASCAWRWRRATG